MTISTLRRLAAVAAVALLLVSCGGTDADGGGDPLGAGDETADERVIPGSGASEPDTSYAPGEGPSEGQGIAEGEPHPGSSEGAPTTDATPRDPAAAECSAGDLVVAQVQPEGVSEAAAETWNAIRNAAMACDYDALAALAGDEFTYSYGGGDDPAGFWAEAEARGDDDPMAKLVQITGTEVAVDDAGNYVWPAVHVRPEDEDAWMALEGIYTTDLLDEWREAGTGYLGYRTAISPEGAWLYFVAGD